MSADLQFDAFLEHLTALRMGPALKMAHTWADRHGVDATIQHLLAAAQHEVGRRWEFGEWTVAQEHAATAIIDAVVAQLHLRVDEHTPRTGPHLALVCAEGEWHVTPARMAAVRFLQRGWHVSFLGASTPAAHLERSLARLQPDVVGVSCTLPANLPGARTVVDVAHHLELPVLAGGRAFGDDDRRAHAVGADGGGPDLTALEQTARAWLDSWVPPATTTPLDQRTEPSIVAREAVVSAALHDLMRLSEATWATDRRAREQVRDDLRWILTFLEVSLELDDPTIFREFLSWLQGVLVVRSVPVEALAGGMNRLAAHLDTDLVAAREALAAGRAWLLSELGARPRT